MKGRKMTRPVRCRGNKAKLCPAFKTIRRDFAVTLYDEHKLSANVVSDMTGCTRDTILDYVRASGLTTRPRGGSRQRAGRCA